MSTNAPAVPLIANRYQLLEKLGAGGMGIVYRAQDRLDGSRVALKRVTMPSEHLQFASKGSSDDFRLALAQEFRFLASLRHPNIISVLDYGFDDARQPYFTMELLENAQSITTYAGAQPLPEQISLLAQVLQALAYLHRRGIIHRDLKPDNTLVANGQVKVLDFGLAVAREALSEDGPAAGTLRYMAPEVLLGSPASEAADLYALGVIAYEVVSGRHPFAAESANQMIYNVLNEPADTTALAITPLLQDILRRLLAKSSNERYQRADELIWLFTHSLGQSIPAETVTIRESYLQAAKFVGRDREFAQLIGAMQAMINGQGSAWLIGGESGVGKSRLLDELRTQALVSGALVLRGQAIAEGGAPYQLWRESLRRLCLQTDLSELEAGVLKSLVPDISLLLQRDAPDAPEIDARAAQMRLLSVIEAVFRRQTQPIVLLLEDLQWAEESLTILKRLASIARELPLLIVANYRDDERPNLPDELPDLQLIKLARLDEQAIAELSASMLGESGEQAPIIDLLRRETEGNVFFIVEVVRALAEEAGQLARVGQMTLPQSVFAGGVQTVIQRRLSRVPAASRSLLQIAAVAGRELDLNVLRAAAPTINAEDWLTSVATVIDVQDNRYRFAHDKLREGLLLNLSNQHSMSLHETVAEATAAAYPDDPAQYAILHYHWEQTGNTDQARHYAELAGETALQNSAAFEAIRLLNRALELQPADVDPLHLGHVHRLLGQAQTATGQLFEAERTLQQAGTELGYPLLLHAPAWRLTLDVIYQFAQQIPQYLGWKPKPLPRHRQEVLREAMGIAWPFDRISQILSYSPLDLLSMRLRYGNWASRAEPSLDQLNANAMLSVIFGLISIPVLARFYLRRAQQTAQVVPGPLAEFYLGRATDTVTTHVGNWKAATDNANSALEWTFQIGDLRVEAESAIVVIVDAFFAGNLNRAEEAINVIESIAVSTHDDGILAWGLVWRGLFHYWRGDYPLFVQSFTRLDQIDLPEDGVSRKAQLILKAYHDYREGRLSEAAAAIELALEMLEALRLPIFVFYPEIIMLARTCVLLEEQEQYVEAIRSYIIRLSRVLRKMKRFFPYVAPGYQLYRGLEASLAHRPREARRLWRKSLSAARKWHLPYDEARALYEMGRHLPVSDPTREQNLHAAAMLFEQIGANWDWELTQVLLETPED